MGRIHCLLGQDESNPQEERDQADLEQKGISEALINPTRSNLVEEQGSKDLVLS